MTSLFSFPAFPASVFASFPAEPVGPGRASGRASSYDLVKSGEDTYFLTMAVPGLGKDDVEIMVQDNVLTITGREPESEPEGVQYLHRGLARGAISARFVIGDHMEVMAADISNGMLRVTFKKVLPEAMKPRYVAVSDRTEDKGPVIEAPAKTPEITH